MDRKEKNKTWILVVILLIYDIYLFNDNSTYYRMNNFKFSTTLALLVLTPLCLYQEIKDYLNKKNKKNDDDKKDDKKENDRK